MPTLIGCSIFKDQSHRTSLRRQLTAPSLRFLRRCISSREVRLCRSFSSSSTVFFAFFARRRSDSPARKPLTTGLFSPSPQPLRRFRCVAVVARDKILVTFAQPRKPFVKLFLRSGCVSLRLGPSSSFRSRQRDAVSACGLIYIYIEKPKGEDIATGITQPDVPRRARHFTHQSLPPPPNPGRRRQHLRLARDDAVRFLRDTAQGTSCQVCGP